jgi:ubiquinone/menaquinone biosynthesis C-methylase UbiE
VGPEAEPHPSRTGVFDEHLAEYYDATRALSDEAMERLVGLLRADLDGRGCCLEIGVGTGRVALPLSSAGVEMVGIDLSSPMLARLLRKGGGVPPFGLVRADATALPFADGAFGAGLVCHVLHLIPRWETALDELARVIGRPGVILVELAEAGLDGPAAEIRGRFHQLAGVAPYTHLGVRDPAAVDQALRALGASIRDLPTVVEERSVRVAEIIDRLEMGIHSSNAALPAETRRRAAEATRSWARARFGDLDVLLRQERSITWRAYDLA